MKNTSPYRCDYCQRDKQETNHWHLREKASQGFYLIKWDERKAQAENADGEALYEHLCSESCAVKALSKWMVGAGR